MKIGFRRGLEVLYRFKINDRSWIEKSFHPYALRGNFHDELLRRIISSHQSKKLRSGHFIHAYNVFHPNARSNLKILHISDTHFRKSKKQKSNCLALSNYLTDVFDLVVHTGDVVDKHHQYLDFELLDFLKKLKSRTGKYFVLGNHDYREANSERIINSKLESAGFVNISGRLIKHKVGNSSFTICGLEKANELSEKSFNILLVHDLDELTSSVRPVVDLVLSGHVHVGELDFGVINGYDFLAFFDEYVDLNMHRRDFRFLTPRTLSYISPGLHSHAIEKLRIPPFLSPQKRGVTVLDVSCI